MACLERRKIERRIRRLEKLQRSSSLQPQDAEQLVKLKEDLEYVRVSFIQILGILIIIIIIFMNGCGICNYI